MRDNIIGKSRPLLKAVTDAKHIAKSKAPVLLLGETGVGKELFADLIKTHSDRGSSPYIKVNCAAIQDALLESDLFGHEKGAFTGAIAKKVGKLQAAHTGTIFLDEVANMSLAIQAKVLRALEYQRFEPVGGNKTISVDIRIISATNKPIDPMLLDGSFRKDLFYRLGVMIITIPPLRERKSDIVALTQHFAKCYKKLYERNITNITENTTKLLQTYHWPGNVRELKNVIERAVLFCKGHTITDKHIHIKGFHQVIDAEDLLSESKDIIEYTVNTLSTNGYTGQMEQGIKAIEKYWILKALRSNKFVQKTAARELGISPRVLCYKMKHHSIPGANEKKGD